MPKFSPSLANPLHEHLKYGTGAGVQMQGEGKLPRPIVFLNRFTPIFEWERAFKSPSLCKEIEIGFRCALMGGGVF
jgi:hypothetical protein